MIKAVLSAFVGAVLSGSIAMPAQALNFRTWISGKGIDQAGCGPVTAPCRTLQYAHDNTSPAGEIDVMDAAGYGAVVISKAINIINDGVGVAGVLSAPGGNEAIVINAGSNDAVVLRGLTIEGGGTGTGGIVFKSGGSLTVGKCAVQNFGQGPGIAINPPNNGYATVFITDTDVLNNGSNGIYIGGYYRIDGSIQRVTLTGNNGGLYIISATNGPKRIQVGNVVASYNGAQAFHIESAGSNVNVAITNSLMSGSSTGLYTSGAPLVFLDRSTITNNTYGVHNPNSSQLYSFRTNVVNGNTTADFDSGSSFNTSFNLQ